MTKLNKRPIEDLINITIEYFDNNTVSNNVTKREVVNAVSEMVTKLRNISVDTIGIYLEIGIRKVNERFGIKPEYSVVIEEALNKLKSKESDNEYSLFSIDELEVSNRVKNALKNNGINNLGELLDTDYSVLESISYFGPNCLSELKRYIHALGLQLKNEVISVEDKYDELNAKGIRLIQDDLLLSGDVVNLLNRNGIFTLQDLIDNGDKVYHLTRMGKVRSDELRNALAKRGIDLENPTDEKIEEPVSTEITEEKVEEPVSTEITEESVLAGPADEKLEDTFVPSFLPSEDVIEKIKQENSSIKERLEQKEKLISEYDKLIEEKNELLKREQELDQKLSKSLEMLQSLKNEEEGLSYGGK